MPKVMIIGLYFFGLSTTEYLSDARHEVAKFDLFSPTHGCKASGSAPVYFRKDCWLAII